MTKWGKTRAELPGLLGILVLSVGLAIALPRVLPFLSDVESRLADIRIASFTAPTADIRRDIVVVAITEGTFAQADMPYRSPVDRGLLATWLEAMIEKGARAVAFDLLFDQATEDEKDRRFAAAVAASTIPIVVAWGDPGDPHVRLTERQSAFQVGYLTGVVKGWPVLLRDSAQVVRAIPAPRDPTPAGAARLAFAPAIADALGSRVPTAETTIAYLGRTAKDDIPFPVFPAHFVPKAPTALFKDRIVLVGAVLPWEERFRTPFGAIASADADMPGVLIHAHALAQIMDGRPGPRRGVGPDLLAATLLALFGIALAFAKAPVWVRNVLLVLAAAAYWVAGFAFARYGGPIVALVMPTLGLGTAYGLAGAQIGRRLRREKRQIRRAFSHYVAPAVVKRLEADPARLKLGGESREVTYIFTDIAGFTTLSEEIDPSRLVTVLNEYLDGMTRIVLDHGGTVDKFIGDAVVAMFNAPDHQPEHPERAVRCALALDAFAIAFARHQQAAGIRFGHTRIGVHTGTAVVGNFGGRDRFDYTAVGDTVNTAARLEGANKHVGTRVLVSGATAARCDGALLRPVGALVVKGKHEPTPVFEPVPEGDGAVGALEAYRAAYTLLEDGDGAAAAAFESLRRRDPDDTLVAFHLERLAKGARGAEIVLTEK